jgi:hypothetical protein
MRSELYAMLCGEVLSDVRLGGHGEDPEEH